MKFMLTKLLVNQKLKLQTTLTPIPFDEITGLATSLHTRKLVNSQDGFSQHTFQWNLDPTKQQFMLSYSPKSQAMICRGEDAANDCAQKVKLSFIIFRRQRQKKAEKVSQREREIRQELK